jgi:cell division septation protein DedD
LIGRSDPFAELEREVRAASQREHEIRGQASAPGSTDDPFSHRNEKLLHDPDDLRFRGELGYGSDAAPDDGDRRFDGRRIVPRRDEQEPQSDWPPGFARPDIAEPSFPSSQQSGMLRTDETQAYTDSHPDHPIFLQALYPQEPAAGSLATPHHEEFYDDSPRPNRRKGLLTVATVLVLAVVGTAGAFGYRTFFGGANSSSPPPVIRASTEPSKVAPPTQPVDQSASKFSYDRFGDRGQNEQVVVREERPVDNRDLGRTSVPRTTLPGASAQAPAGVSSLNSTNAVPPSAFPNPPSALGEPRRVRTVPIRPEQSDTGAVSPPSARQATPPVQVAPVFPPPPAVRQPSTVTDVSTNSRAEAASSAGSARTATPRANARVAARTDEPVGNAPLSLSPEVNNSPPAPTAPREAPSQPRAAPTRIAAASAATGGFLVQVSSQRSEADAENSYRSIQAKYSSVLNGQRHVIKRADLGSKGVYYRAMVGPFGRREQAVQLCVNLKAAGGDCVVQAN